MADSSIPKYRIYTKPVHGILVQGLEHDKARILYGSSNQYVVPWGLIHSNANHGVSSPDNYTTPMNAINIVITTAMAWTSDTILKGRRWPMIVLGAGVNFIVCVALAATPVFPEHKAGRWFLYYMTGWAECSNWSVAAAILLTFLIKANLIQYVLGMDARHTVSLATGDPTKPQTYY